MSTKSNNIRNFKKFMTRAVDTLNLSIEMIKLTQAVLKAIRDSDDVQSHIVKIQETSEYLEETY